jgi:hypothetical protein
MIYLFDNCYLSTTNTIVETAKHVWIGDHQNLDENSFDIYKTYSEITAKELDDLFQDIHDNVLDVKLIIYCDIESFQYVYSVFFNGVLSKSAVIELYSYDRLKENFGLGDMNYGLAVTGIRKIARVDLPENLKWVKASSEFSASLPNQRLELEFATAIQGDSDSMEFCVDRVDQMYDGSPGFWVKYAEQTLPAIMSNEEYTIENLIDSEYTETYLDQFKVDEFIPNQIVPIIKEKFGYNYHRHFFTIINNTPNFKVILDPVLNMTKREFVETRLLDPKIAIQFQLLFPNLSNFDSVNPIFWNAILQNQDNTAWLKKYKVTHGTDNQTNGTV